MKLGNVILAIFLWLCIPASFVFGAMGYAFGGRQICMFVPVLLFILGIVALITGRETKQKQENQLHDSSIYLGEVQCPHCLNEVMIGRADVDREQKICPHCGQTFFVESK
jgi:hypothetical protein